MKLADQHLTFLADVGCLNRRVLRASKDNQRPVDALSNPKWNIIVSQGINRQYDIEGYINNTKFINSRLPDVVREILANSQTPPIIMIQGDHGYQLPAIRFDILNAYYFPDQNYAALYPTISPVNTFRVVLNTFFDEEFPLLKDHQSSLREKAYEARRGPLTGFCDRLV